MAESSGSSEFLLGIEEYLKYLGFDRMAQTVHNLSRTIELENSKEETIKVFLQDFGGGIDNVDVADIMHNAVKANGVEDFRLALLHYLGKVVIQNQDLKDYVFATIKSEDKLSLQIHSLKFIGKKVDDQELKDFIFAVLKATSNDDTIFKALLQYIGKVSKIAEDENVKDLIFSLTKASSSEIVLKALLQYIGKVSKIAEDENVKDLIFSLTKASSSEIIFKSLLKYIGKLEQIEQNEKDLIFAIIKTNDFYSIFRSLLNYLGKTEVSKEEKDLIYSIMKATNKEGVLKSVLQYIGKVETEFLSWLSFNIKKIDSVPQSYCILLDFITKHESLTVYQADLIHGFIKSEDSMIIYKSLLQYLGKVMEKDYNSMSLLSLTISRTLDSPEFRDEFVRGYLTMLDRQFLEDKIFRGINNYIKNSYKREPLNDAFSRSQIKSKIWLVEELAKIQSHYKNVVIMAGWFGQLKTFFEKHLTYSKMRNIELDRFACEVSDYIFNLTNLENYKVKSVNANINSLTLHQNGYEWEVENFKDNSKYTEKYLPDLIVNTSAEHMTEEWFNQIRFKELEHSPIVAVQSNNLFDIDEHINCVYSIDHMKKKFPMKEILYEGELQLKGYKRVMLIGRP